MDCVRGFGGSGGLPGRAMASVGRDDKKNRKKTETEDSSAEST